MRVKLYKFGAKSEQPYWEMINQSLEWWLMVVVVEIS